MVTRTTRGIIDSLREQEHVKQAQLKPLLEQVGALEKELADIAAAIAALEGDPHPNAHVRERRPPAARGIRGSSDGASLAEVLEILTGLLTQRYRIDRRTIEARLRATFEELGKNKQGLRLVLQEALRDSRFREKDGEYMLRTRRCWK